MMTGIMKRIVLWCIIGISVFPGNSYANPEDSGSEQNLTQHLQRTCMADGGFKETNYAYLSMNLADPYATCFINETKKLANIPVEETANDMPYLYERLLEQNTSYWNLMDVYSAIMLSDGLQENNAELYAMIQPYFDTLYQESTGCYQFLAGTANAEIISPTYYVNKASEALKIPLQPIESWLTETVERIERNPIEVDLYSGCYSMLYELLQDYNVEMDESVISPVIECYEKLIYREWDSSDEKDMLLQVPLICMDLLKLCDLLKMDSSAYHGQIGALLGDEEAFPNWLYWEYDYYGLYAVVYSLEASGYPVKDTPWLMEEITKFNQFMLKDDVYISPSIATSSIVPTYYAHLLIESGNLPVEYDLEQYCESLLQAGIDWNAINLNQMGMLLELFADCGLLPFDEKNQAEMTARICEQWDYVLATETWNRDFLYMLNQLISIMDRMGMEYQMDGSVHERIVNQGLRFIETESDEQTRMDLRIELARYLLASGTESEEIITELSRKAQQDFITSASKDSHLLLEQQYRAMKVFRDGGISISNEFESAIRNMVEEAYFMDGLYRSGTSEDDMILYQNTYFADYLLGGL